MYQNLVLSGGSLKGISFVGCLKYMEEKGILQNVKNYIGSSFGALICFYIVIGHSYEEICHLIKECLIGYESNNFDLRSISKLLNCYGIDDGKYIIDFIETSLEKKLNVKEITFLDLTKKTGKNFVVCAANLTDVNTTYFSVNTFFK